MAFELTVQLNSCVSFAVSNNFVQSDNEAGSAGGGKGTEAKT